MGAIDPTLFLREIYDAAFDDEAWFAMMPRLAREFFSAAHGQEYSREGTESLLVSFSEIDVALAAEMVAEDSESHPGLRAIEFAQAGKPILLEDFVEFDRLPSDDITRRFFDPHGFNKAMLVRLPSENQTLSYVSLFRRRHDASFSPEERALVAMFAKHLSAALRVRDLRISTVRRQTAAAQLAAQGRAVEALIIATRSARVIELDLAAENILSSGSAIRVRGGRLVSASPHSKENTESLRDFVARADAASPPLRIRGRNGELLRLTAFPVGPEAGASAPGIYPGVVALAIEQRPRAKAPDLESFALYFQLTPAEARLLGTLIASSSLTEAAASLRISRDTAKKHLSSIFRKTDTDNQAQLMLRIGSFS